MKMKLISALTLALVASGVFAQSETYQFEAAYTNISASAGNSLTQTGNQFSGTYYLKPVAINTGAPLFEAEFLQRASNIGIAYSQLTYEDATTASTSIDVPQVSGKLYMNDVILGIQTGAWNKDLPLKSGAAPISVNSNTTNYEIGYFVMPNTSVSYINQNSKASYSANAGLNDLTITSNGLLSRTVMPVSGGQHLAFSLSYNEITRKQATTQVNTEIGGSLRYYPETKMYVEVGYIQNSGDYKNNVGTKYSVGLGYAITPRFGVSLASQRLSTADSAYAGSTTTTLSAGYRF